MIRADAARRVSGVLEDVLACARSQPAQTALIECGGKRLTYGELARQVEAVSAGLERHGMRSGDRVLFSVRPSITAIILILATTRIGGVIVAADPGMGAELFRARMKLAHVSWGMAESILLAASASPVRAALRACGLALPDLDELNLRFIRVGPWLPWGPPAIPFGGLLRPPQNPSTVPASHHPDAPVFIVFTSGTTGNPRAVLHTDANLGSTLHLISHQHRPQPGDVVYTDQLHSIVPTLLSGATAVIAPRRFEPRRMLANLHRYTVTHLFAVPFDLQRSIDYCATRGAMFPSTVKSIVVGAAPVQRSFLERLRRVVSPGTEVWSVYAMTEMLPICMVSLDEKLAFAGPGDLVGKTVDGVSTRVAGDGELIVSGPNLCHSYLDLPALHELATGDLARIDTEGRVVLLGRKKDMIIRGHHNIYPALYEEVVLGIDGVRQCAFVGVYDEDAADERVVLVVEPRHGTDRRRLVETIRHELRHGERRIDSWAQPDHTLFMDLTVGGRSRKLDREAIRRRVEEALS